MTETGLTLTQGLIDMWEEHHEDNGMFREKVNRYCRIAFLLSSLFLLLILKMILYAG